MRKLGRLVSFVCCQYEIVLMGRKNMLMNILEYILRWKTQDAVFLNCSPPIAHGGFEFRQHSMHLLYVALVCLHRLCISPSFICSMDSYFEIHMLKVAALLIHLISHFDAFTMPYKHKLWSICYQFLWQMLLSLHLLAILFFPFSPCNEAPLPHL